MSDAARIEAESKMREHLPTYAHTIPCSIVTMGLTVIRLYHRPGENMGSVCPNYDRLVEIAGLIGFTPEDVESLGVFCDDIVGDTSKTRHNFCLKLGNAVTEAIEELRLVIEHREALSVLSLYMDALRDKMIKEDFTPTLCEKLEEIAGIAHRGNNARLILSDHRDVAVIQQRIEELTEALAVLSSMVCPLK